MTEQVFAFAGDAMVWLPSVYTSPTLFLVNHPNHLGTYACLAIFAAGMLCIFINYLADRQRQYVRNKNGECTIWKKKPDLIFANYKTEWGEEKQSLLLASGWWGISRHFHYLPEILGAFFWSMPALFSSLHALFLLHLPFPSAHRPLLQTRKEVRDEVRQRLGQVLRKSPLPPHPICLLGSVFKSF